MEKHLRTSTTMTFVSDDTEADAKLRDFVGLYTTVYGKITSLDVKCEIVEDEITSK